MSNTSRRVVISCLIIGTAIILCIGVIGITGVLIYSFYPLTASEQEVSPPPVILVTPDNGTQPAEPGQPTTPEASPEAALPVETPAGPTPEASLPAEITSQMDEIQAQVVELRGLEPLDTVDRYLLTPDQLRTRVIEDFLEDYTPEEARDDARVLGVFGLLEPEFELYDFYVELLSEQVVGFYDTDTKEMYVIQGSGFSGPERLTYAHEYVHALQDQHYQIEEGLGYNDENCELNTDYCAAISSLLEGDASLSEMQWLYAHATAQDIRDIQEFYQTYESPIFESSPSFLREDFIFPYRAGQEFVETIYDLSGWQGVDQVYANPPLSTEQILHPERYPDVVPVTVELPDLQTTLGEGWREVEQGTWGEWYTYLVLAEGLNEATRLDPASARQAADGWAGDSYRIYSNDQDNQMVLVLRTVWKNETEAAQFVEAFQEYAQSRFGPATADGPTNWIWETGQVISNLDLGQAVTTWTIAPHMEVVELIREAISLP
jgi:hypothetical protein